MGRKKKGDDGKWKPRKLKCHVCKDPYMERPIVPGFDGGKRGIEHICPKCEKQQWDAACGNKPIKIKEVDDVYRKWNKESGWGAPDADI